MLPLQTQRAALRSCWMPSVSLGSGRASSTTELAASARSDSCFPATLGVDFVYSCGKTRQTSRQHPPLHRGPHTTPRLADRTAEATVLFSTRGAACTFHYPEVRARASGVNIRCVRRCFGRGGGGGGGGGGVQKHMFCCDIGGLRKEAAGL